MQIRDIKKTFHIYGWNDKKVKFTVIKISVILINQNRNKENNDEERLMYILENIIHTMMK